MTCFIVMNPSSKHMVLHFPHSGQWQPTINCIQPFLGGGSKASPSLNGPPHTKQVRHRQAAAWTAVKRVIQRGGTQEPDALEKRQPGCFEPGAIDSGHRNVSPCKEPIVTQGGAIIRAQQAAQRRCWWEGDPANKV